MTMSRQQLLRRIAKLEKRAALIRVVKARDRGPSWEELAHIFAEHGVDFNQIVRDGAARFGQRVFNNSREFWVMMREMLIPYPQVKEPMGDWMERRIAYQEQQKALASQANRSIETAPYRDGPKLRP
jgi:hypothetical protein